MSILVKKHMTQGKLILAACDSSLLGKVIDDGQTCLDISSSYFHGTSITPEKIGLLSVQAASITAVGEETINALIGLKMIEQEGVKTIGKIPYAFVFCA